jgi:pimeloyl-ACP methyl ester carboxylesterase
MPDGPLTIEEMADDAAGVLHALGIPVAHVVGFSGGSNIAQEFAASSRDRPQPGAAEHLVGPGHEPAKLAGFCRACQLDGSVAPSPKVRQSR